MATDPNPAIQDHYPDDVAHCYGCGRFNDHGLQLKTRWDGDDTVARFSPRAYHTAIPGFVYGGLLASLIDCHAMGTAAAAGAVTVRGEVVAVRMPASMTRPSA